MTINPLDAILKNCNTSKIEDTLRFKKYIPTVLKGEWSNHSELLKRHSLSYNQISKFMVKYFIRYGLKYKINGAQNIAFLGHLPDNLLVRAITKFSKILNCNNCNKPDVKYEKTMSQGRCTACGHIQKLRHS